MRFLFFNFIFFISFQASALEEILEENRDVIELCFIDFFNLESEHENIASLKNGYEQRVSLSADKQRLKDLLLQKHMNEGFFAYITRDYLSRNLSEVQTLIMYRVTEEAELESLKDAYTSRLLGRRTLLRRSNEVPHFKGKGKKISFREFERKFIWDNEDFSLKVTMAEDKDVSVVKSSRYFDDLRHSLHNLMLLGSFDAVEISLEQLNQDAIVQPLDPNFLFQQLYSLCDNSLNDIVMLGDIDSLGKYRKYGYLRYALECPYMASTYILSEEATEQLLEIVVVEGISILEKNIFLSAGSLKQAVNLVPDPLKLDEESFLFRRLMREIKHKSKWPSVLKSLDRLLSKNPNFLSAVVLKLVLQGKVKKQLSYASSYNEFNYFFRSIDEGYVFEAGELTELNVEMGKISKVIHPAFREMLSLTMEISKDKISLTKIPKPKASSGGGTRLSRGGNSWRSVNQRMFKNLRSVRQKRDVLLDQQKVIEEIFDR